MAAAQELVISVRVRGMWRVILLGWAIRLFSLGRQHVEISVGKEG